MAYTPYSQALPDTSRYTLDPVLQERLYQPVRPDPYQAGMLSTMANDYYADPFGYTNRRFGALDEVLATDTPEVGLGGMFAPLLQNNSDGGNETPSLTPEQIAFFDNETPEARDARMGKINSMLSLVAQGLVPGLSTLSIAQMGPTAYGDMVQGHSRTVAGDTSGYDNGFRGRAPGVPAPVMTGDQVQAMEQAAAQAQANAAANAAAISAAQSSGSASDFGGDLGTGASDAAGFGGYGGVW